MIYEQYLTLDNNFHPVFDITNEVKNAWKRFIPTRNFYTALDDTLNSLDARERKERLSIWLQGTYGTGKSHSVSVIKHLLSEEIEEMSDFIEKIDNIQIKNKWENFRRNNKVCCVVLKGVGNITNSNTFSLTIQLAVRKAFPDLVVRNDFETLISLVENNNGHFNWDNIIDSAGAKIYGVNDTDGLIQRLKNNDFTIYLKIRDYLAENLNIHFGTASITDWLMEVLKKLREENRCNKMMIFWDEFTSVLESPFINTVLNDIQNLAELSSNDDIFLFLISHRMPAQAFLNKEDYERIQGRFKRVRYEMENITTYHIINGAIIKTDKQAWENVKNDKMVLVQNVLNKILSFNSESRNDEKIGERDLKDLFPIHPYTAYLLTFVARNLGSAERSIFNFIFDDNVGFRKFIADNPEAGNVFLTADVLWDYFLPEFERNQNENISPSLQRWRLFRDKIIQKGQVAFNVFKVILLLNILYRYTSPDETSLVTPSENNIISIFEGVFRSDEIENALKIFESVRTPDNLYLLAISMLNSQEVEQERNLLIDRTNDIKQIITNEINNLKDAFTSNALREVKFELLPSNLSNTQTENLLNKIKKDHKINVCCYLGIKEQDIINAKKLVKSYSENPDLEHIVFLVCERPLGEDNFNKYIDFNARANVSMRHNYNDDYQRYKDSSKKIIEKWIDSCISSTACWYLRGESKSIVMNTFSDDINKIIAPKIFSKGFDTINPCVSNRNIWNRQNARTSAEIFLYAKKRQDIEERTARGVESYLRSIIVDKNSEEWLIDTNCNFTPNAEGYPIRIMFSEVDNAIKKNIENNSFNIAEVLEFLSKPPYGLFPNKIFYAAMGFLMRNYTDKLYEVGTGLQIDEHKMVEIIKKIFDYWEGSNNVGLTLRIGTVEERRLTEVLKDIFEINDANSLNNIKWKIREKIKGEYPLWIFANDNLFNNTANALVFLDEFIRQIDEELNLEKINEYLNAFNIAKTDLKRLLQLNPTEKEITFKNWISDKLRENRREGNNDEVNQVVEYLAKNMQEERSLWEKIKVVNKIRDWIIYTTPLPPQGPESVTPPPQGPEGQPDSGREEKIKRLQAINAEKIKQTLIQLSESNDYVLNLFLKVLGIE